MGYASPMLVLLQLLSAVFAVAAQSADAAPGLVGGLL